MSTNIAGRWKPSNEQAGVFPCIRTYTEAKDGCNKSPRSSWHCIVYIRKFNVTVLQSGRIL
jgi:hypothetical protein